MSITEIEKKRAQFAYECAKKGSELNKKSEYKSYVKKIPMMIKVNGLAQTFAFVSAKSDEDNNKPGYAYKTIYDQVTQWLKEKEPSKLIADKFKDNNKDKELIQVLIELDSKIYRQITNEVLALFMWLRRFVDSLIDDKKDSKQEGEGNE